MFCVGTRDSRVASYWIDTLVLKNCGKYLRYFAASSFPLQGNPTQCSRGSKKNFWRRCRGGSRKSRFDSRKRAISGAVARESTQKSTYQVPITNPLSPALHYLPFASRFPLPHFTIAVLFALSLSFASFSLASCLLVCWIACLSRWLKIILNCVTSPIPIIMISLALRLLLLLMLNLVKLIQLC